MISENYQKFTVSVATTSKNDARSAGRELAEKTLNKLGSKPNLFLLISSIHYENNGGFKELLNGIWEVLPEGTPLIGGTFSGFLNQEGVFAKGATAFSISSSNIDISIGYGKNTKRSPKKAAKQCIKMIKKDLKNRNKNKFLLSIISGVLIPKTGSMIVQSKIMVKSFNFIFKLAQITTQKGFGNEKIILKELTKELPEFSIIHSSSQDDQNYKRNYQFFNNKVLTNSIVCLGIETDIEFKLNFSSGAQKSHKKILITDTSKNKTLIKKINNKPAYKEFLRIMNWEEKDLNEENWISRTIRYPLVVNRNNRNLLCPIGIIVGDQLGTFIDINKGETLSIDNMTPEKLVNAVDQVLDVNNPLFGLFSSCSLRQQLLGYNVFKVQEKLKQYFKDEPFLLFYGVGEGLYLPDEGLYYLNETITSAIFKKNV